MLPPVEICSALRIAVEHHVGLTVEELVVEASRLLGFARTGAEIRRVFEAQVRRLLHDDVLVLRGDRIYLPR
jgi:hypothetical protein